MKPHLPSVTLICADTTNKAHLAERAILKSMEQCSFGAVKLLTNNMALKHAVKIPKIEGLDGYSKFCVREMARYVQTPYAIVCQADGYILRSEAWTNDFLKFDYIGSPFNPSGVVGNGGFSGRSKRLLDYMAGSGWDDCHPEDSAISGRHKSEIESLGMRIAPIELARRWGIEGRSWDQKDWQGIPNKWNGELGFHSWLTPLPHQLDRPMIYCHAGDLGDVLYSLPVIKSLGAGYLFLSPDCRYPYPLPPRWTRTGGEPTWADNLKPLLMEQDYIWGCSYTPKVPFSIDRDLNAFRKPWKNRTARDFDSIFSLHHRVFGTTHPENEPWLTVTEPVTIPGRDIIVNRTDRYHNNEVDWYSLVQVYSHRMAFIGSAQEASVFEGFATPKPVVPWFRTDDMLAMARVIAGGKVFIGNQSSALAIAHGLGKRVIVEEWPANRNCHLNRGDDAIYWNDGEVQIPESWLK